MRTLRWALWIKEKVVWLINKKFLHYNADLLKIHSTIGERSWSSQLIHFLFQMIKSFPVGTSAMLNNLHTLTPDFQICITIRTNAHVILIALEIMSVSINCKKKTLLLSKCVFKLLIFLSLKFIIKRRSGGCRGGPLLRSTFCYCRGLWFNF